MSAGFRSPLFLLGAASPPIVAAVIADPGASGAVDSVALEAITVPATVADPAAAGAADAVALDSITVEATVPDPVAAGDIDPVTLTLSIAAQPAEATAIGAVDPVQITQTWPPRTAADTPAGDVAILFRDLSGDIELLEGDLRLDNGLATAVLISLFSDRRADESDRLPDGDTDRRGWWGDAWPEIEGDKIGSRLWLLYREKQLQSTVERAREYAEESLAWLIETGAAERLEVEAWIVRTGVLGLRITVWEGQRPRRLCLAYTPAAVTPVPDADPGGAVGGLVLAGNGAQWSEPPAPHQAEDPYGQTGAIVWGGQGCAAAPEPIPLDADTLVITYSFTEANGRDLDTRTRLLAPLTTQDVGWSRQSDQLPWLDWGGDNTGYGVESVVIYADIINNSYPGQNIEVELRCFWYSVRSDGNMSVDIVAYKGGTISQLGFGFINTGGQQVAMLSRSANVVTQTSSNHDGETVGIFRYNRASQTFQWL
jgi:phage gp46-like protein